MNIIKEKNTRWLFYLPTKFLYITQNNVWHVNIYHNFITIYIMYIFTNIMYLQETILIERTFNHKTIIALKESCISLEAVLP